MTNDESSSARVLIVDDEPLIRWSLAQALSDRGCSAVQADSRQATIEAVSQAAAPFDVAVLDLLLPDSNDLAVTLHLRRVTPNTQIILMTALGTPEIERQARDAGVYGIVGKPFELGDLTSMVLEAHRCRNHGLPGVAGRSRSIPNSEWDPLDDERRY